MIDPLIRAAIEEEVSRHGAAVIDLAFRGERGSRVLQVFIDSEAGVTVGLCTQVSRDVASAIRARNLVHGTYRLEVSSPGIDRPLVYPWQYRKHSGRTLRVRWRRDNEAREDTGVLAGADEVAIELEMGKKGETLRIPFQDIRDATVVAPW